MKIQIKRSNQLVDGEAKAPEEDMLDYGELAVNFNEADPAIFIKASDGAGSSSIVRLAGANVDPPPPTGSINQPTVLTPPDGAGIGGDVTYTPKTSAITNVSGDTLTLTNSNTYDNADGSNVGTPISQTFLAGQTVSGVSATGTYGTDAPAFETLLWTGTSANQALPTTVDLSERSLFWTKERSNVRSHFLYTPGVFDDLNFFLKADNNSAGDVPAPGLTDIASVDSTSITLGNNNATNYSGSTYAGWGFRAAPGFFDIVTYTGDGTDKAYAHSLGTKPGCMIVKNTNETINWEVYHQDLGHAYPLILNSSGPVSGPIYTIFSAEPTASEFSVGGGVLNYAGYEYVAYLFADTPGKIKCGSFSGATTLDLGFKLGWIMLKNTVNNSSDWIICDSTRGFVSPGNSPALYPNSNSPEGGGYPIEVTDTTATINTSNSDLFIYVAIAEDAVAGEFGPTGTLTADADDNGPTITLSGVTGTWEDGMEVVSNTEITEFAPGADVLEFTSTTPAGTSITTYGQATWEVDTDANFSSPMTAAKTIVDGSIQELLPSERGAITLDPDTTYNIRVKYDAADPSGVESAYSDVNQFKTGAGQDGWNAVAAPEANSWQSVIYGNGTFVAISQDGTNRVMYSTDGITWTAASAPEANSWSGVTYGDGKFVAVSVDGTNKVMYSTDGITWNAASGIANGGWTSVTYGNGKFVAVTPSGTNRVMYSTDGITWNAASGIESGWMSVTYGNGKFVAVAWTGTNRVMYSTDGINWTAASAAEASGWQSVAYGNGKFVAVAYTGTNLVMYSTDGINWTAASAAEDNYWYAVTYGGGKFVAVATNGTNRVMWSETGVSDPATFTAYDADNNKSVNDLDIVARYGVDPTADNTSLGIYELTQQPTTQVQGYIRSGDKYQPVHDYCNELENAQAEAKLANTRLDEANVTIETMRSNFEARIAALESGS